jgi:hypothetical protein
MIRPSKNEITLPFGATSDPYTPSNPHKGVDFSYLPDNTIYMPDDGTVTLVPNNGNDGNGVYFTAGGLQHGLLHTSKYLVNNGAFVKQGTPVAIMGATGYTFGVHLHWAVKKNGVFVNGLDYVTKDAITEDIMNKGDVFNCFLNLEHRTPTEADYAAWVGQPFKKYLDERGYGAVKETQLGEGDVINVYYHLLKREPEPEALKFWQGHSGKELFYAIINSSEYIDKHK